MLQFFLICWPDNSFQSKIISIFSDFDICYYVLLINYLKSTSSPLFLSFLYFLFILQVFSSVTLQFFFHNDLPRRCDLQRFLATYSDSLRLMATHSDLPLRWIIHPFSLFVSSFIFSLLFHFIILFLCYLCVSSIDFLLFYYINWNLGRSRYQIFVNYCFMSLKNSSNSNWLIYQNFILVAFQNCPLFHFFTQSWLFNLFIKISPVWYILKNNFNH